MAAKLIAEEGELKGLVLSLDDGDQWIIGRDPEECQIVVDDPEASRKHLIAQRTPEGITVQNLSATNPIKVNEEDVNDSPRLLQDGDTVQIGSELFRYYQETSTQVTDNESDDEEQPAVIEDQKLVEEDEMPTEMKEEEEPTLLEEKAAEPQQSKSPDRPSGLGSPPPTGESIDEEGDSIFEGTDSTSDASFADITFGIPETGRWLLKVVGGPNNGAEFYMQAGHSYTLGTDPHSCDIVFHDTSVSRQHARIIVTEEDSLTIEDLKSRNGVLISNERLEEKQQLSPSVIVSMGTTSFVVYDREGEMHTIISPLLPSIVKTLQHEEEDKKEAAPGPEGAEKEQKVVQPTIPAEPIKPHRNLAPLILITIIVAFLSLSSLAIISLFKSEPVVKTVEENTDEVIQKALEPFPAVRFSFNKTNGTLLLLGHVVTQSDKSQLLYIVHGLNFIKNIDDSGLIIDEGVWQDINTVLARNPAWQGISIHSPSAGQFVLTGYLRSRKQAEQLSDYLSVNFHYLDLLKNQVIVEEEVLSQISAWLQQGDLRNIVPKIANGEITLTGSIPGAKIDDLTRIIQKIKEIPGVRGVNNFAKVQAPEQGIVNVTDQYQVTGQSKLGEKFTVIINGRILSEGDIIDGMKITKISPNMVLLEKEGTTYRIDY